MFWCKVIHQLTKHDDFLFWNIVKVVAVAAVAAEKEEKEEEEVEVRVKVKVKIRLRLNKLGWDIFKTLN